MELNSLKAFIAVAESGSFTEASERLFLTQPAISKRIAALEEELGGALFDRIGRRSILTEAGAALLPKARAILRQVEESRRVVTDLSGKVAGDLHIGTSHHIGLHRLPEPLRQFSRDFPAVQLDIRFLDSEEACRGVESGSLELAIVTLPNNPAPVLKLEPLWQDPLDLVCHRDHPLAKMKSVTIADLAKHPAILPGPGTFTRELIEAAFKGYRLQVSLSTNYLETNKMLIAVGLGWGILPASMVEDGGDLRALDSPLKMSRDLGLVSHTAHTPSNAARAMGELLRGFGDTL
jgi:DNA-binding transcriptional LysR family regulator